MIQTKSEAAIILVTFNAFYVLVPFCRHPRGSRWDPEDSGPRAHWAWVEPGHMALRVGVGVGSPGGRAGRPERRRRRQEVFGRQAGGWTGACSRRPFLTDLLLGLVPSRVGTQAPSPGPPVAVKHTVSAFPRAVPSSWACSTPHPQALTLWRVRGCVAEGGAWARVGGEGSVRSVSAWL